MKKLFNQHKKKIFYILGTLFLLNLVLLFSNSGILVSEKIYFKVNGPNNSVEWHPVSRKDVETKLSDNRLAKIIVCTYWMGRGTFQNQWNQNLVPYCNTLQGLSKQTP